ncbi:hypothetical protein MOPEL_135_02210 [Mobilicoccus pelagius NBRC 104925]|uniref:VOC domain-containing protein n=2 Tax=Mobilicoccus TaxID=984996 RepID=H5UW75_9MICO|nr:hypothetical protein MOPEL_135_02210 [Mobilicoccus pelagius NBRC 104925]
MLYPGRMADPRSLHGLTFAINAGEHGDVLEFYTHVFGRGADTKPMDDFLEWQVCEGAWLQISTGHERPGGNNARVRFEVEDMDVAVARLGEARVPYGEVVTVPDVVQFVNFSDNWGNALGYYHLFAPRPLVTEEERLLQQLDMRVRTERRRVYEQGGDPGEVDIDAIRAELGLPPENASRRRPESGASASPEV